MSDPIPRQDIPGQGAAHDAVEQPEPVAEAEQHAAPRHRRTEPTASQSTEPRNSASALRVKVPIPVWTATALHLCVMIVFTLLYPAYWGFDETGHVSRVLAAQSGNVAPTPGAEPYVGGVNNSYQGYTVHDQQPFITYNPPSREDRPSFIALGGANAHPPPGELPNQLAQHRPVLTRCGRRADAVPGAPNLAWDQTVRVAATTRCRVPVAVALSVSGNRPALCTRRVAVAAASAPILLPALERLGGR